MIQVFHGTLRTATCALAIGIAAAAGAQTVLIDFGNDASYRGASTYNPDSNGNYWNSLRTGVFYQDLIDIHDFPTTIDFGFSTDVATDSYNGPAGQTSPITDIPESKDPRYFVQFVEIDQNALGNMGGSKEAAFDFVAGPGFLDHHIARFELQQLDPAKVYDLSFFGSHKFSDDPSTVYRVYSDDTYTTLVRSIELDVQNPNAGHEGEHNQDTIATLINVAPHANGIVFIEFVGTNGRDGYLNELRIVAHSPARTGDYNNNGRVDAADYTVWRNNLGTHFDLNGNGDDSGESAGVVDMADYYAWKINYQPAGAGTGTPSEIPEPGSLILMVTLAGCSIFAIRRR